MEYTFLLQETVKFWWGVMFLFFDCFQLQNGILFLFFKKHFYLLKAKITTLFVLIFALSRKKSICARKLVQNLRWKRQCGKFNTRENLFFFVKNKGKFFFQNQRFLCKFIHLCTVGRMVLPVQQQKRKTRRIKKQCYSQLF